jgi:integral membrane protein
MMLISALQRFRTAAFIEGLSYLVLLFVAMPLKYFADMPMAVTIVGSVHGALFVAYMLTLANVYFKDKWTFAQGLFAFIVSLIPFATFYMDVQLRKYKKPIFGDKY